MQLFKVDVIIVSKRRQFDVIVSKLRRVAL